MATFSVDPYLMKKRLCQSFKQYLTLTARNLGTTTMALSTPKPPNVLVYSPQCFRFCPKDCPVSTIENCLSKDRYVVYRLPHDRCFVDPWMENCQMLVIPSTEIASTHHKTQAFSESEFRSFLNFLTIGGKILNFSADVARLFNCEVDKVSLDHISCQVIDQETNIVLASCNHWEGNAVADPYAERDTAQTILSVSVDDEYKFPVAVREKRSGGEILHCMLPVLKPCILLDGKDCEFPFDANSETKIIAHCIRELGLVEDIAKEKMESPETPCLLLASDSNRFKNFFSSLGYIPTESFEVKGSSMTLKFCPLLSSITEHSVHETSEELVPIIYEEDGKWGSSNVPCRFNVDSYFEYLHSKEYGRILLYADVVTSTMDILEPLLVRVPPHMTVTCIASQQTKGKGRSGNKWISPVGTAMFSVALSIPLQSRLGQHLSILQHFTTVAVAHAIRTIPGLSEVNLRVKWPNDIYFGSDVKIGGVLVKSTIFKDQCIATIGCGVNVDNKKPTICINDIIHSTLPDHRRLSCEEVLAKTITCLEQLITEYQAEGPEHFLSLYYKYWIHSNAKVQVEIPADAGDLQTKDATIQGVDEWGFLQVTLNNGQVISLQPDGNSFDIMKNLIIMKSDW